jgi:PAS domain S-box-containing protein
MKRNLASETVNRGHPGETSLAAYLFRLVLLGMVPLMLLGVWMAWNETRHLQAVRQSEADQVARRCAEKVDARLGERLGALQMLAASPLLDDRTAWPKLYREAQAFHDNYGSHLILASLERQMLFNTRVPLGSPLPMLPVVKGQASFPVAIGTGRPAVSDCFLGPVAKVQLASATVPVLRQGKPVYGLVTTFETSQFQECLDQVPLPAGWTLTLADTNGAVIARFPPGGLGAGEAPSARRFSAFSGLAPWSVTVAIPASAWQRPTLLASIGLGTALLTAIGLGLVAGRLASRRVGLAVADLAHGRGPADHPASGIREISSAFQRLASSETRFEAVFEQAAVGMALVATDGNWLHANRKLCGMLGYTREELLATTFQALTLPGDLDPSLRALERLRAGEVPSYSLEKHYLRKDGSLLQAQLTATLARKPDGSPDYVISVIEDIAERKRAEAEVLRLNATLEQQVAEQTAELKAANQELESFSYAVSHDLRAPLRAMAGFSQALVEDYGAGLAPEARSYLDEIIVGSVRMGDLIDGLLDMSRNARQDLQRQGIDLSVMAARIIGELRAGDPRREVAVTIEPGLQVSGDPRMVGAVLQNLLGNAWKYTGGRDRPSIRLHQEERDGCAWICVADNGAGFDMAHANRLFKPFQRLHRQDEFPGLGIGLATVQRIIHRHGGRIEAWSEPGQGASFRFTLPRPLVQESIP